MHRVRLLRTGVPLQRADLSPRQRIVMWRDIQARTRAGLDTRELLKTYQYQGIDTCAATGLCAQRCPVGINTGELVKKLRGQAAAHGQAANWLAEHFTTALRGARLTLAAANGARKLLGAPRLSRLSTSCAKPAMGACPNGPRHAPSGSRRRYRAGKP